MNLPITWTYLQQEPLSGLMNADRLDKVERVSMCMPQTPVRAVFAHQPIKTGTN